MFTCAKLDCLFSVIDGLNQSNMAKQYLHLFIKYIKLHIRHYNLFFFFLMKSHTCI